MRSGLLEVKGIQEFRIHTFRPIQSFDVSNCL